MIKNTPEPTRKQAMSDEEYGHQLFVERDALKENSPERKAVAEKILEFIFSGGRRL
jgi:hypothetical protein